MPDNPYRRLVSETRAFLDLLDTNGGTLGGYQMQDQRKRLEQALQKARGALHRDGTEQEH